MLVEQGAGRGQGFEGFYGETHAGKDTKEKGGWTNKHLQVGDVAVLKLEAHQLSLRVQRLGAQTFTVPTNGVPGLRVQVCMANKNRVQLSRAEPGEEY